MTHKKALSADAIIHAVFDQRAFCCQCKMVPSTWNISSILCNAPLGLYQCFWVTNYIPCFLIGSTVPAVFAIPATNRPGFTGYFIPTPPTPYRNQAWMSYAGENELQGQWADSVIVLFCSLLWTLNSCLKMMELLEKENVNGNFIGLCLVLIAELPLLLHGCLAMAKREMEGLKDSRREWDVSLLKSLMIHTLWLYTLLLCIL